MKILCATDLQPGTAVIERAQWLARKLSGELTVFHAVAPDEPRGLALEQRVWRADAHLRARFDTATERPHLRVRVGDPGRRIAEIVNESATDLVVLGASARGASSRVFGRSIAERVLRDTRRPALIVRQDSAREYARVLIALDVSSESAAALRFAESLALTQEEITFLVHAYRPPYAGMLASVGTRFDRIDMQAEAWRQEFETGVRQFLRRHSKDPWRYRLIMAVDRAVPGILAVAERIQPDLLVLGTRAQGLVLRTLTGSVGNEVADAASCDVLLVPPRAAGPAEGTAA
jgi:nucleotide-binding universal stress UspA family protein